MSKWKKILCPTDWSEPSYAALAQAAELAGVFDAELCLLHVVPFAPVPSSDMMAMVVGPPDAQRLDEAKTKLQEVAARLPDGVKVRCEVKMGYADKEIACAAADDQFDLLVIATHGLSGWRHMVFGSVAEAIVRQVHCPVLTVRAAPPLEETDEAMMETGETINGTTLARQEIGVME